MSFGGEFGAISRDNVSKMKIGRPNFTFFHQSFEISNHLSSRKLVIIGDGACGKTSLLSVFTLGYFPKASTWSLSASHR